VWDPFADFETEVLPNGLKVCLLHLPGRTWQRVGVVIHSGAKFDSIGREGTAHFVEHLCSKNAQLPYEEFKNFFYNMGGTFRFGETGYHYTEYEFMVPISHGTVAGALQLFGDMLLTANLNKFVERERKVILSEYQTKFPLPIKAEIERHYKQMVHYDTWLERFITPLGNPDSIKAIDQADIDDYRGLFYTPANMTIVAVGSMDMHRFLREIAESPFSVSRNGERQYPTLIQELGPPKEREYVVEVSKHFPGQPCESGGLHSYARMPKIFSLELLDVAKSLISKKLFAEVRNEKGWAYTTAASYYDFSDFYEMRIVCEGLPQIALSEISNVVSYCIDAVASDRERFESDKRRWIVNYDTRDPNGSSCLKGAMSDLRVHSDISSYAEEVASFESVTFEDLQKMCEWLSPERRWNTLTVP
jgi:predicted Zn-dependent peptidase